MSKIDIQAADAFYNFNFFESSNTTVRQSITADYGPDGEYIPDDKFNPEVDINTSVMELNGKKIALYKRNNNTIYVRILDNKEQISISRLNAILDKFDFKYSFKETVGGVVINRIFIENGKPSTKTCKLGVDRWYRFHTDENIFGGIQTFIYPYLIDHKLVIEDDKESEESNDVEA